MVWQNQILVKESDLSMASVYVNLIQRIASSWLWEVVKCNQTYICVSRIFKSLFVSNSISIENVIILFKYIASDTWKLQQASLLQSVLAQGKVGKQVFVRSGKHLYNQLGSVRSIEQFEIKKSVLFKTLQALLPEYVFNISLIDSTAGQVF